MMTWSLGEPGASPEPQAAWSIAQLPGSVEFQIKGPFGPLRGAVGVLWVSGVLAVFGICPVITGMPPGPACKIVVNER
jgi:hypothetical protein